MAKIIRFPGSTRKIPKPKRRRKLSTRLDSMVGNEDFIAAAIKARIAPQEWDLVCDIIALMERFRKL